MSKFTVIQKRIASKIWMGLICLKDFVSFDKNPTSTHPVQALFKKYKDKNKIVVFCNGPSAASITFSKENLYLITNSGYQKIKDCDFLFYINDGFYLNKTLAISPLFLKKEQEVLLYFDRSESHLKGYNFFNRYSHLVKNNKLFFLTELLNQSSIDNYNDFHQFYAERQLPVKIQNSGVFLLLFGYYMAFKMKLPLEIYGLDLGLGGAVHFNNKGLVGKSVLKDRVKVNVKMYLDYMYNEKNDVQNFSNYNNNQKD